VLTVLADKVDTNDVRERIALVEYIDGASSHPEQDETLLRRWLDQGMIEVVAVPRAFVRLADIT
jgi:hypothetical protein